jgi:hypothetical protein
MLAPATKTLAEIPETARKMRQEPCMIYLTIRLPYHYYALFAKQRRGLEAPIIVKTALCVVQSLTNPSGY